WVKASPFYYDNYDCGNWYEVLKQESSNAAFFSLLEDLRRENGNIDSIIRKKVRDHFRNANLSSIENMKGKEGLFSQIQILAGLDYFAEKNMFGDYRFIAINKNREYGGPLFFKDSSEPFNVCRYIDEGQEGHLIRDMQDILLDENKLSQILSSIMANDLRTI
ncbi:MAG: hypothetical protein ACTHMC_08795, partial [Pseudobacter sp.]|uniref:hypothetical protein n=1 Tax=Pseudobacter sp. TaxID=2045420 RepID=UPI003F812C10